MTVSFNATFKLSCCLQYMIISFNLGNCFDNIINNNIIWWKNLREKKEFAFLVQKGTQHMSEYSKVVLNLNNCY